MVVTAAETELPLPPSEQPVVLGSCLLTDSIHAIDRKAEKAVNMKEGS